MSLFGSTRQYQSYTRVLILWKRSYTSRAHPKPKPSYPIADALQEVLKQVEARKEHRALRWERRQQVKQEKGEPPASDASPYRHFDETMELALNLNLDPRKPGQALRGSMTLPHGASKKSIVVVVFSLDEDLQNEVKERMGDQNTVVTGGNELVEEVLGGRVPLITTSSSDVVVLATEDMVKGAGDLKKCARLLGPRGLYPNAKVGTLVKGSEELLEMLDKQVKGTEMQFRTEKSGIVHSAIGKASFGVDKLMDNVQTIMRGIYDLKPEMYGKGKKKASKNAKYFLTAHVCSTQSKSVKVDLRTLDPTSAFFMGRVED